MKNLILFCVLIASYSFTYSQQPTETVTDVEGNVYKTVIIGSQTWMAENLKTTKYNTGAPIRRITSNGKWATTQDATYCWYDDDEGNKDFYGALYSEAVIEKGNLAPKGWHIPSNEEWEALADYLGGKKIAGHKLKATGTDYWEKPNKEADNSYGFAAMPNGHMEIENNVIVFRDLGVYSDMWSSSFKKGIFGGFYTAKIASDQWAKALRSSLIIYVNIVDSGLHNGVRCIKD